VKGGNPAFKVYDIDPDTFEVMDVKVYSSKLDIVFHWINTDLRASQYI
jgi:hypothetical protein